jgi:hypothetical protein
MNTVRLKKKAAEESHGFFGERIIPSSFRPARNRYTAWGERRELS